MGSLRGDDGDGRPPPDKGLPDLPPEWGVVVVPDDLTELDRESAEFRRELRRKERSARWRRRFGLAPRADSDAPPVGIPLLIMCIAIIAALTSLFAITFTTRTASDTPPNAATPVPAATVPMVDLALDGTDGKAVRLQEHLPAVILLLDGCACGPLVQETAAAAPSKVTVLVIDKTVPQIPPGVRATALADPEQALLAIYGDGPDRDATPAGVPTALLVDGDGVITSTVSPALTVDTFRAALAKLA